MTRLLAAVARDLDVPARWITTGIPPAVFVVVIGLLIVATAAVTGEPPRVGA